jgi:hypothetical protein
VPFRAHQTLACSKVAGWGSFAQMTFVGDRGGLGVLDVRAPRIGDRVSPTDCRRTRQNDGRRHPTAAQNGTSGVLVDGTCHRDDLRNVPKSQRESGILFETTKGSAWQRK